MSFSELFLNLIYPPRCVHCDEIMSFDSMAVLCDKCKALYEREKEFECPICRMPHYDCDCTPGRMGIEKALHVSEYSKDKSVTRSIILYGKEKRYKRMFRMIAEDAAGVIKRHTDNFEDTVVCYVPRDPDTKSKKSFDQAETAAHMIADILGIDCIRAIKRKSSAKQKLLGAAERDVNAKKSYEKITGRTLDIYKKRVILYDDVMTSGATVHACTSLLKQMGARSVTVITFGRTYIDNERK